MKLKDRNRQFLTVFSMIIMMPITTASSEDHVDFAASVLSAADEMAEILRRSDGASGDNLGGDDARFLVRLVDSIEFGDAGDVGVVLSLNDVEDRRRVTAAQLWIETPRKEDATEISRRQTNRRRAVYVLRRQTAPPSSSWLTMVDLRAEVAASTTDALRETLGKRVVISSAVAVVVWGATPPINLIFDEGFRSAALASASSTSATQPCSVTHPQFTLLPLPGGAFLSAGSCPRRRRNGDGVCVRRAAALHAYLAFAGLLRRWCTSCAPVSFRLVETYERVDDDDEDALRVYTNAVVERCSCTVVPCSFGRKQAIETGIGGGFDSDRPWETYLRRKEAVGKRA